MAGIVGEIQAIGIPTIDPVLQVALVVIPADEVDRVRKIGARCRPATRFALVAVPGAIQRLRIAVGIRTGTGTPNSRETRVAAVCQLLNQPSR